MRRTFRAVFLGVVLAAAAAAARADVITLEDGRQITGQIIEETPQKVTVRVPYGTFSIERARITGIEKQSPLDYHLAQGDLFAERGEFQVALREYREGLLLAPDDKAARQKLASGLAKLARHYVRLKRYADARELFAELDQFNPGNLDARVGRADLDRELAAANAAVAGAEALLAARRFEEAAAAFDKAVASCPDRRAELVDKLGSAVRGLAEELYSRGRYAEAAGNFARAVALKPDLAGAVEGRFISSVVPGVVEAINSRDLEVAKKRLGVLLGFAPTDPRVLYLQGALYANEGKLAPAAGCFARALGRSPPGSVSAADVLALHKEVEKAISAGAGAALVLDKPFEERYVESRPGDWLKLEGRRFTVFHHNELLAAQVLQAAEFYLDKAAAGLDLPAGSLWSGTCPIYLHRDQDEYRKTTGQESWSGGVYSLETRGGKLVSQKISSFQTAPKLLNSVLPHEIAHLAFMASIGYGKKFPLALHEGVAVGNEPAFRRAYYRGVLKSALATESTHPVEALLAMTKYPDKPDLFYAESMSLVEYLVETWSAAEFYKFALEVESSGLAGALQKQFGFKDLADFERSWKAYAAKKQ